MKCCKPRQSEHIPRLFDAPFGFYNPYVVHRYCYVAFTVLQECFGVLYQRLNVTLQVSRGSFQNVSEILAWILIWFSLA